MNINYSCWANNLIHVRCCLSDQFEKIVDKERVGQDCKSLEKEKKKFLIRQMYMDKLFCINPNKLEKECLTRDQILEILEVVKSYCKPC